MYEKRLNEIQLRKAELVKEVDTADEKRIAEIEAETAALEKEEAEIRAKMDLRGRLNTESGIKAKEENKGEVEARAQKFAETRKMNIGADETINAISKRAILVSGGTLATPTKVSGINDMNDAQSSIIDMVHVENAVGMSTDRVAYVSADSSAAVQTEGSAVAGSDPTYAYVDITPTSLEVVSQISKQAKKQSPLQYEAKTRNIALKALKKKAISEIIAKKVYASTIIDTVSGPIASTKGKLDEKTLRNLVLAYGGDEISGGQGVLFLTKTDLIAFGDIRGTNEKKAIYEIIPDANPNTGIIKDGGLSVKYCLCSDLNTFNGTSQGASDKLTMFFGDPMNFQLDLFSDYEVRVSEDFAFTSLMDTIVGDCEVGGAVVVKHGFVALKLAHS